MTKKKKEPDLQPETAPPELAKADTDSEKSEEPSSEGMTTKKEPDLKPEMPALDDLEKTETQSEKSEEAAIPGLASVWEVFSFGAGLKKTLCLIFGLFFALVAGSVLPFMVFYFSRSFKDLVAPPESELFMDNIRDLTFAFLVMGYVTGLNEVIRLPGIVMLTMDTKK